MTKMMSSNFNFSAASFNLKQAEGEKRFPSVPGLPDDMIPKPFAPALTRALSNPFDSEYFPKPFAPALNKNR